MYAYMANSQGVVDMNKMEVVGVAPGTQFRRRGEVGPNDDPQSFKRMMAKKGFAVVFSSEDCGEVATASALGVEHLEG